MERNKIYRISLVYQLLFLEYSLLTIGIYFFSKSKGMNGITLPFAGGGDDGFFYWRQVESFLNGGQIIDTSIYPSLISRIVAFVGFSDVFVVRIFNFFGFLLLVWGATLLLRRLSKSESINKRFDITMLLYTNTMLVIFLMFYLSLLTTVTLSIYRDVWIYFFYILSIYLMNEIMLNQRTQMIFLLVPSLYFLGGFRTYALVAFLIATALIIFMQSDRNHMKYIVMAIIAFSFYYTFFIDFQVPIVNMSLRNALDFRQIGLETNMGGSNMNINLNQPNIFLFFLNYMYSFLGNLVGPFPWGINSFTQIMVFFMESIPMIAILIYLVINRKRLTKNEILTLTYSLVWMGFIALSNDNIGTATRLRATGWIPMVVVFISVINRKIFKSKNYQMEILPDSNQRK